MEKSAHKNNSQSPVRINTRPGSPKANSPSTDSKYSTGYKFDYMAHLDGRDSARALQEMGRQPARNGQSPYSRVVRKQKKEQTDCCHRLIRFYSDENEIKVTRKLQ